MLNHIDYSLCFYFLYLVVVRYSTIIISVALMHAKFPKHFVRYYSLGNYKIIKFNEYSILMRK